MLRRVLLAVGFFCVSISASACSDDEGAGESRSGDIRASEVWKDGLKLTGSVSVYPGAVVEIEPGATISCAPGVRLIIGGTLRKAAGARARIACEDWVGIAVAQGGRLELDGLELENPSVGIETTEGAGESTLKDGVIKNSLKPFLVGKLSTLTLTSVKITTPKEVPDNVLSIGDVFGTLVASRLDYDAGPNEGISLKEGGSATIEDSNIHGTNGQDMVSAYNAKSLKLSYSTLTGAHCGPHIDGIESFTIDHVTSEKNTYGLTIYGAGAGPNLVKDSNISGDAAWIDLQGDHGPITFENVYTNGGEVIQNTAPPNITKKSETPIANAKPR